jgi:hypothetical protein
VSAISDGTFELNHARLVRVLATLCPAETLAALRAPLCTRTATHAQPRAPQEKAELAAAIECVSGLLAAAAPAAAVAAGAASDSDGGGAWLLQLLHDGLVGSTLEMGGAWGTACRYALDALLAEVRQPASPVGPASAAADDCMEFDGDGDAALVVSAAASPAAMTVAALLQAVADSAPSSTSPSSSPPAAVAVVAVAGPAPPSGATSSTRDQKHLQLLVHLLASVRRLGPWDVPDLGQQSLLAGSGSRVAAAAAAATHWRAPRVPRAVRLFLGQVMQQAASMLEVEQPAVVRDALGRLLAQLAMQFAAPPPLAAGAAAGARRDGSSAGGGADAGSSSGCSTPVVVDLNGGGGAGSAGSTGAPLLLINSSMAALRAQAGALIQTVVDRFLSHAALLQLQKNSGAMGGGGGGGGTGSAANLLALGGGTGSGGGARTSDHSSEGDLVMVEAPPSSSTATPAAAASRPPLAPVNPAAVAASVYACSVGLQVLNVASSMGEKVSLSPLLTAMLPGVLQLQELSGPGMQLLAADAKAGFVRLKYLPFTAHEVDGVAGCVLAAGSAESWSTRAAALVYLQILWFRHCFLLAPSTLKQLQAFVAGRLQDPKVEVAALATNTLSGIIKAAPPADNDSLRAGLMAQVPRLFVAPGKGRAGSGRALPSAGGALAAGPGTTQGTQLPAATSQQQPQLADAQQQQLAVIRGLKAFVLSSPYDVPLWMADVLMALVAAANSKNPLVRRDASKALAEFKRTHEEDALEQLRTLLGEERWEALSQVTSSATYFV